jgi:RNA polymerase sigma-70 factor (ECF subfamily)
MVTEEECKKNTDEELASLSLADSDYYACLVNRYTEPLRRYIIRLGGSLADSDDILQEVFLNAYLHLNGFNRKLKFSSWIYRIAHNQAISLFRKLNVRPTVELKELGPWQDFFLEACPGAALDQAILSEMTRKVLDKLDPGYREVLALRYMEEKDYSEISDILKKPMGTVAIMISRAKKKFAEMAEKESLIKKYEQDI